MATRAFYDGFEAYSVGDLPTTNWDTSGADGGSPQVVTSALDAGLGPRTGSKMARVNWIQAGAPVNFTRMLYDLDSDWNGAEEIFIRLWFRFDSDFSQTGASGPSGVHCFRMAPLSVNLDFLFSQPISPGIAMQLIIDTTDVFGGNVDLGGEFFETDQWNKLEMYFKHSATTAAKVWFNGTIMNDGNQDADASGFAWSAQPKFTGFNICSNYSSASPGDDNNHLYVDDFEVFTNLSNGVPCTGSMSDATIESVNQGTYLPIKL